MWASGADDRNNNGRTKQTHTCVELSHVYVLLFCLSHLAADTMTVGSWECTIIKLGDAAYHDILVSAGLELTLLLSFALCISGFLGSGEGICVTEMYVYMKYI